MPGAPESDGSGGEAALETRIRALEHRLAALTQRVKPGRPPVSNAPAPAVAGSRPTTFTAGGFAVTIGDPAGASVIPAPERTAPDDDAAVEPVPRPAPPAEPAALDDEGALAVLGTAGGRLVDGDNRRAALELAASVGRDADAVRLIGGAARRLRRSFISLRVGFRTGDDTIAGLVAMLTPAERRIVTVFVIAGIPLNATQIERVLGPGVDAEIDALATLGVLHADDDGSFRSSPHVERLLAAAVDAEPLGGRLAGALCATLDDPARPAARLHDVETFLLRSLARPGLTSAATATLALKLADAFAAIGDVAGWRRTLDAAESAAQRAGEPLLHARVRHDIGIAALVAGDARAAAVALASAVAARRSAGDRAGVAASEVALAWADEAAARPPIVATPSTPSAPTEPPPAALPPSVEPASVIESGPPSETAAAAAGRPEVGTRRRRRVTTVRPRAILAFCLAAAAVFALAFVLRPRPAATVAITEVSSRPTFLTAGSDRGATLCVTAASAAVVEVFPAIGRLPGGGRRCTVVRPRVTTTYVAVATGATGDQARAAVTVTVNRPEKARIATFTATPGRIASGEPIRLCYAVSGARRLRIEPDIGTLARLRACRTVTLRGPRRYSYALLATDDRGDSTVRHVQIDVVAAHPRRTGPSAAEQIAARRAVYQFDITPARVVRGQAASLCVGVDRGARGFVTHLGALPAGITRCYRVAPRVTTVYRLYVATRRATAVEAITVAVNARGRRHDVARIDRP